MTKIFTNVLTEVKKSLTLKPHKVEGEHKVIGWMSVIPLTLLFFFWFALLGSNNTLGAGGSNVPIYRILFGNMSQSQFVLFTSMFLIGNVVAQFLLGILLDIFSIKKIVLGGAFAGFLLILGLNFVHSSQAAIAIAFFVGLFLGSIVFVPTIRLVFHWFHGKNAALPISFSVAFATLGGVMMGFVGPSLVSRFGNHSVLIFLTIMLAVFWIFIWIVREKEYDYKVNKKSFAVEVKNVGISLKQVFKSRQNLMTPLIIAFLNLPLVVFDWSIGSSWMPKFFNNISEFNHNANTASNTILSIMLAGVIIGTYIFGKLADSFGRRKLFLIVGTIFTIITTCLLFIGSPLGYPGLCIIFFLNGFFAGSQSIGYAVVGESNLDKNKGVASSLNSSLVLGLGAVFQNIFVALWALPSVQNSGLYIPLLIIPIAMFVALICSILIRDTGTHEISFNSKFLQKMFTKKTK